MFEFLELKDNFANVREEPSETLQTGGFMTNYGVILKKIRNEKKLSLRQAALQINRGLGWLSEVENNKPRAKITKTQIRIWTKKFHPKNQILKI